MLRTKLWSENSSFIFQYFNENGDITSKNRLILHLIK